MLNRPNNFFKRKILKKKIWSPGVPRVPISGPNRGMFSKLNEPNPLGLKVTPIPFLAMADFRALRGASAVM